MGAIDDAQFVMPSSTLTELVERCRFNNDDLNVTKLELDVGVPLGRWSDCDLSRIDVTQPSKFNLRLPSGNEMSANELWIPGGFTSGGLPEACTARIPRPHYKESPIVARKKK